MTPTWEDLLQQRIEQLNSALDEINRLKDAIREHRDQKADDRCWLDDQKLYAVLGEGPAQTALPPREEFLKSCANFYDKRQNPTELPLPCMMTMRELQDTVERCQERIIILDRTLARYREGFDVIVTYEPQARDQAVVSAPSTLAIDLIGMVKTLFRGGSLKGREAKHEVYNRAECIYQFCPDPPYCKAQDKCQYPSKQDGTEPSK